MTSVPRGDFFVDGVFDPWNPPQAKRVTVPATVVDRVLRYAPRSKFHLLRLLVPGTLERPDMVFRGLRRDLEEGTCYVARTDKRYDNDGLAHPAPIGFVFAVYLDEDERVYEWRFEPEEDFVKWEERFEEKTWPRT